MASRHHEDDFEDDGRVIADMSGVGRPSLFGVEPPMRRGDPARERGRDRDRDRERREPEVELTTKERVWMILGALKAGLSVSIVYVIFLAAVIAVMLLVWS